VCGKYRISEQVVQRLREARNAAIGRLVPRVENHLMSAGNRDLYERGADVSIQLTRASTTELFGETRWTCGSNFGCASRLPFRTGPVHA
jgi:hypothetical protein